MKILNEKKYKFQCKQCYTEILFSKKDCWVDVTYEDFWLTCPVCGSQHNNQTYGLFLQEYKEDIVDKDKEIERLNNIINKINKILEADTHCENIYYAIGVLLNKRYFDIKMVDNEELLNILGSDK